MVVLPPDLSRLGDELTAATARALDERRRRRHRAARASACVVAGIVSLAALAPTWTGQDPRSAMMPLAGTLDTVLVRPPDRPPLMRAEAAVEMVLVRPPDRPPLLLPGRSA
jgi:hypothetical protein